MLVHARYLVLVSRNLRIQWFLQPRQATDLCLVPIVRTTMHVRVLTTFVGIALLTPVLVKRPSTFIKMHTVLFVARIRPIVRVPAPLGVLIPIFLAPHRAETARLRPVDKSTGRRIWANAIRIVRTIDTAQVEAGRVHTMRSVPDTGRYTVNLPFYVTGKAETHRRADRETFHVAHSTVPVHSITVKMRNKPIVITIDRTDTRNALLLLIFVLESDPTSLGSERVDNRGKIGKFHGEYTI